LQATPDVKQDSLSKTGKISEILGMREENLCGKDWNLREIKKNHLTISSENTLNIFEILNVNVNRSFHQEFNIPMNGPIKPKQNKTLALEYDLEEPERTYRSCRISCISGNRKVIVEVGVD